MLTGGGEGVLGRGTPLHAPHEPPTHPPGTALNQTKLAQWPKWPRGRWRKLPAKVGKSATSRWLSFYETSLHQVAVHEKTLIVLVWIDHT